MDKAIQTFNNAYEKHYIIEAKGRNCWTRKKPNIKVGDLVLIQSHGTRKFEKRAQWSPGRVVQVHLGRDKLVRRADLRHVDQKIRTHPIHDLFPLIDEHSAEIAKELEETT